MSKIAKLEISKKYSSKIKKTRRVFAYSFLSDEIDGIKKLVGTGKTIRMVSLADYLYDGELFDSFCKAIYKVDEKSELYPIVSEFKKLPIEAVKKYVYNNLVRLFLPLVLDKDQKYIPIGKNLWLYTKDVQLVWKGEYLNDYFINKKTGERQYLPPTIDEIDPEFIEESPIPIENEMLQLVPLWNELQSRDIWWEPRTLAPSITSNPNRKGKLSLNVSTEGSFHNPVVLASLIFDEDVIIKSKNTELNFGKEIKNLRTWIKFEDWNEAGAKCELFNSSNFDTFYDIYFTYDHKTYKDGEIYVFFELPIQKKKADNVNKEPSREFVLEGKVKAEKK